MRSEAEQLKSRALYLSYDGMTDPLGQAQVIPYLEGLAKTGVSITLISFEKPRSTVSMADIRDRLQKSGIEWRPLRYTKRPSVLSTVWDLQKMRFLARWLARAGRFDVVHCRSYLPAMVGLELKRRHRARFIFDMRGFWPDEKVDAGSWPQTRRIYRWVYSYMKRREVELLAGADAVVSLTHAGMSLLNPRLDVHELPVPLRKVIPCSVDFSTFDIPSDSERSRRRAELGISPDSLVMTYLGSLGTWYMLEEMLDFFVHLRRSRPDSVFLVVTPDSAETVHEAAARRGLPPVALVVRSAARSEIPGLLAATDIGLFFIRPTPSKVSSSPTKLGEFLAMGIPVVTNRGIGDVEQNLTDTEAGVVVESFSEAGYGAAVDRIVELAGRDRLAIRRRAAGIFDMESAVSRYVDLYERLTPSSSTGPRELRLK